jgi:hypothetical protein
MTDVFNSLFLLAVGATTNLAICWFISELSGAALNDVVLYYSLLGLASLNRRTSYLEASQTALRGLFK